MSPHPYRKNSAQEHCESSYIGQAHQLDFKKVCGVSALLSASSSTRQLMILVSISVSKHCFLQKNLYLQVNIVDKYQ